MSSLPSYPSDQLQQNNPPRSADAGLDPAYPPASSLDQGTFEGDLGTSAEGRRSGAMGRMRSSMEEARRRLPEIQDRARAELYRADDYVRMHPYQALGVAALIGAAVGLMLGGRRR